MTTMSLMMEMPSEPVAVVASVVVLAIEAWPSAEWLALREISQPS